MASALIRQGIGTLDVAANPHRAAARRAIRADPDGAESNVVTEHFDAAASGLTVRAYRTGEDHAGGRGIVRRRRFDADRAAITGAVCADHTVVARLDAVTREQRYPALLIDADRIGIDLAGVANRSGKDFGRAAGSNQLAEVDHFMFARLHLEADIGIIETRDRDRVPRREDQFAARGFDETAVLDPIDRFVDDARREQDHFATRRRLDVAPVHDRTRGLVAIERIVSGEKILVRDVQGRHDEAGRVDRRALPDEDPVAVDQEHASVGREVAEQLGHLRAGHAIEDRARRVLLNKAGRFARADTERLPVHDAAGRVRDLQHAGARGRDTDVAVNNRRTERIGGRDCTHAERAAECDDAACR